MGDGIRARPRIEEEGINWIFCSCSEVREDGMSHNASSLNSFQGYIVVVGANFGM